jgi:predicted metal-dependent peptidase
MKPTQAERIAKARMRVILVAPFFGALLMRLQMVRDDSIQTFCTDGESIRYNEAFAAALDDAELRGVLVHEVAHCAQGHLWRMGHRDHRKWNAACDYQINDMLETYVAEEKVAHSQRHGSARYTEPWKLPAGALLDPQYAGLSSEEIYARLPDAPSWQSGGPMRAAALGQPSPGEFEAPKSKEDGTSTEPDWQVAVAQAAMQAKMRGALPASLNRFVGELLYPKVPWRELLRDFMRKLARDDYSWRQPNRRYVHTGIILPSLRSERMGRIAIAVDTSGSVDDKLLSEFQAEVQAALDECSPEAIDVIYCDAAVQHVEEFFPGDAVQLRAKGGGGTDFDPVFEHLEEHAEEPPAALIYLTDGYGSCTCPEPGYPVLWATVGAEKFPFGQVVAVK